MNFESFEDIKVLMDNFDPAALLPDLSSLGGMVELVTRIAVLAGPLVLLIMGLAYLITPAKEANYHYGYRCYFGMGSVQAWRFTQRLAGLLWSGLGLGLTVVMFLVSTGFGRKDIVEIISSGVTCLIWEAALIAVSCLAINILVMIRYDRRGDRRME